MKTWAAAGLLTSSAGLIASPALADAPVIDVRTGDAITPTEFRAWLATQPLTRSSRYAPMPAQPEVKDLAVSLAGASGATTTPQAAIDRYIRDAIKTEWRFGSSGGGLGALINRTGTMLDQAELMVSALVQLNEEPTIEYRDVTMTAAQFGRASGIVKGLVTSTGAFTVSAAAACRILANGGVPVIVNNTASRTCTLTGNLTTVTFVAPVVVADGQSYLPWLKYHDLVKIKAIGTLAGCGTTCGTQAVTAMTTGATIGTENGVPYISGVNKAGLETFLNQSALNTQNAIEAAGRYDKLVDVVGGKEIRPRDSTALYQSIGILSASFSSTPDVFRTGFTLSFDQINQSFWGDELTGRHLMIYGDGDEIGNTAGVRRAELYVDLRLASPTSVRSGATTSNDILTLQTAHPYLRWNTQTNAMVGPYSRTMSFDVRAESDDNELNGGGSIRNTFPFYIHHGFGLQGGMLSQRAAQSQHTYNLFDDQSNAGGAAPPGLAYQLPYYASGDLSCKARYNQLPGFIWNKVYSPQFFRATSFVERCLRLSIPLKLASYSEQSSAALDLVSRISDSTIQVHDSVGWMSATAVSLSSAISVLNNANIAADSRSAAELSSVVMTRVEGAVQEQAARSWRGVSAQSYFDVYNQQGSRFYDVTPTNYVAARGLLVDYNPSQLLALDELNASGLSQILTQRGRLGAYTIVSPTIPGLASQSLGAALETNATYAFSSAGAKFGFYIDRDKKGAGALPARADRFASELLKEPERASAARVEASIAPDTGVLTLNAPEELRTGAGDFPSSLGIRRRYSSATNMLTESYGTVSGYGLQLPGGWTHNLRAVVTVSSPALQMLGEDSALDASATIAGLHVAFDLFRSPSFNDRMAGIFASNWLGSVMQNSGAQIDSEEGGGTYVRLPSGTYNPPNNSRYRLKQMGTAYAPVDIDIYNPAYSAGGVYHPYTWFYGYSWFDLISPEGDIQSFYPGDRVLEGPNPPTYRGGLWFDFHRDYWSFPSGAAVVYARQAGGCGPSCRPALPNSVYNHLGRSITFNPQIGYGYFAFRFALATNDANQSVSYSGNSETDEDEDFIVRRDNVEIARYRYGRAGADLPVFGLVSPYYHNYALTAAFGGNRNEPAYLNFTYDGSGRARSIIDGEGTRTTTFAGGFGGEQGVRGAVLGGPLGDFTTLDYVNDQGQVAATDALGATSVKRYDKAGRLLRQEYPEGNAVEYQYDVRGNVTRQCEIAKGRVVWSGSANPLTARCSATAGDLVTTTVFSEASTVWNCVNIVTCNRPTSVTNPKGGKTDYLWDEATGNLLSITGPAIGTVRPVTSFGYSTFTSIVRDRNFSFSLLTSKVEKISSTASTTTTYSYDAANKFLPKDIVVDSGGLALRTCFKFDAVGNLVGRSAPKANLAACP